MGHAISHVSFPATMSKEKIAAEINEEARYESDSRSGLPSPIKWLNGVCESKNAAMELIDRYDAGVFYGQFAVQYKVPTELPKEVKELRIKLDQAQKDYRTKNSAFHFKDAKSQFIACKKCGSKLSVQYLNPSNTCPLCRADLRPQSTIDRLAAMQNKIDDIKKKLYAAESKPAKNTKIMWLVKYEYHV